MNRISEKHKLCILMVMLCIAALVAHFRFFRTSATTENPQAPAQTNGPQGATFASPSVPMQSNGRATAEKDQITSPISRNIFEPAGPLPVAPVPPPKAMHAASVQMSLRGTILGGNLAMAIINDQFMRQGQKVGKYRITRITPDKVYLTAGEERRCLTVLTVSEAMTR